MQIKLLSRSAFKFRQCYSEPIENILTIYSDDDDIWSFFFQIKI